MSFKPANYFEATPIEVANNRSDDQNKKTATLIGLRRERALYGEFRLKRILSFVEPVLECFNRGLAVSAANPSDARTVGGS